MKPKTLFLFFTILVNNSFAQRIVFENDGLALSEKDSLKVVRVIRYESDFYRQFGVIDSIQIKLHLFENQNTYRTFLIKNGYGAEILLSNGLYSGKTKELLVPKTDLYLQVIFHEISHYIFHLVMTQYPGWLNEGLAKYFENTRLKKDECLHVLNDSDVKYVKSMLAMNEIDLKKILSLKGKDIAHKSLTHEGFVHKVGYCIVYLLNNGYSEVFKQIVVKINSGIDSSVAIDTTFPGGFQQFESVFNEYYK